MPFLEEPAGNEADSAPQAISFGNAATIIGKIHVVEHASIAAGMVTLGTFEGSVARISQGRKACDLPKLFLRLRTEFQTPDFPMTLAKWFFDNSLVDYKGLEFYHHH